MVKAGKYDWSNGDITPDHYPIPPDKAGKSEAISTRVFHFNRSIFSPDAVKEMEKEGYRPATAHEIMAFGEKNPELQRQFPIVALGSVWRNDINRYVLVLNENDSKRKLNLNNWDGDWNDNYRFLGVRQWLIFLRQILGGVFQNCFRQPPNILPHGNSFKIRGELSNNYWLSNNN